MSCSFFSRLLSTFHPIGKHFFWWCTQWPSSSVLHTTSDAVICHFKATSALMTFQSAEWHGRQRDLGSDLWSADAIAGCLNSTLPKVFSECSQLPYSVPAIQVASHWHSGQSLHSQLKSKQNTYFISASIYSLSLCISWSSEVQNSFHWFVHPALGVDMAPIYQLLTIHSSSTHQVLTHILSTVCCTCKKSIRKKRTGCLNFHSAKGKGSHPSQGFKQEPDVKCFSSLSFFHWRIKLAGCWV